MSEDNKSFIDLVDESFKTIHTGEIVKGTVIDVKPEEIILNIGYKSDGILTRNEYSNDNSLDLTTVVKKGDEMDVKVVKLIACHGHEPRVFESCSTRHLRHNLMQGHVLAEMPDTTTQSPMLMKGDEGTAFFFKCRVLSVEF